MPQGKRQSTRPNPHKPALRQQAYRTGNSTQDSYGLPLELQQAILDVFAKAFPIATSPDLRQVVQEVKGHLFNRDFRAAFGTPAFLDAYALRWSAARALAYTSIFIRPSGQAWFSSITPAHNQLPVESDTGQAAIKVTCIGGGAGAEIVSLVAASRHLELSGLDITAVDMANWQGPVKRLTQVLESGPLSTAALSDSGRNANRSTDVSNHFKSIKFVRKNVLAQDDDAHNSTEDESAQCLHSLVRASSLCTIMFTLNELFSSSIARTTRMLLELTDAMSTGSHLVVVDSPGSYSEVKLGKTGEMKRYPMKWLLDHTLLTLAADEPDTLTHKVANTEEALRKAGKQEKWKKIEDNDSVWFRLDKSLGLRYSVDLENTRYQIHIYRRN